MFVIRSNWSQNSFANDKKIQKTKGFHNLGSDTTYNEWNLGKKWFGTIVAESSTLLITLRFWILRLVCSQTCLGISSQDHLLVDSAVFRKSRIAEETLPVITQQTKTVRFEDWNIPCCPVARCGQHPHLLQGCKHPARFKDKDQCWSKSISLPCSLHDSPSPSLVFWPTMMPRQCRQLLQCARTNVEPEARQEKLETFKPIGGNTREHNIWQISIDKKIRVCTNLSWLLTSCHIQDMSRTSNSFNQSFPLVEPLR